MKNWLKKRLSERSTRVQILQAAQLIGSVCLGVPVEVMAGLSGVIAAAGAAIADKDDK